VDADGPKHRQVDEREVLSLVGLLATEVGVQDVERDEKIEREVAGRSLEVGCRLQYVLSW
jgi:hypothetical protein